MSLEECNDRPLSYYNIVEGGRRETHVSERECSRREDHVGRDHS